MFDPLGFYSPVSLQGKMKIQDLWTQEKEWDEALNQEITEEWQEIENSMKSAPLYLIRRFVGHNITHLVAFTDASIRAYACIISSFKLAAEPRNFFILILSSPD